MIDVIFAVVIWSVLFFGGRHLQPDWSMLKAFAFASLATILIVGGSAAKFGRLS